MQILCCEINEHGLAMESVYKVVLSGSPFASEASVNVAVSQQDMIAGASQLLSPLWLLPVIDSSGFSFFDTTTHFYERSCPSVVSYFPTTNMDIFEGKKSKSDIICCATQWLTFQELVAKRSAGFETRRRAAEIGTLVCVLSQWRFRMYIFDVFRFFFLLPSFLTASLYFATLLAWINVIYRLTHD